MLIVFLMITTYFSRFFIYLQGLLNVVVVFQVGQIYFLLSSYCNNNTVSLFLLLLFFFFYYTRSTGERVISFQIQCNNNIAWHLLLATYVQKKKEKGKKKKRGERERERGR